MAISRAFAFSPNGSSFPGDQFVQRVGDIVYLEPGQTINFAATGLAWYNGPDEDDNVTGNGIPNDFAGYVVCVEGVTTAAGSGTQVPFKFYKSNGKNESAFIALATAITGQFYATGNDAANGLIAAGHATNWPISQQQITYSAFYARESPCGDLTIFYVGSDGRYYINESGDRYTGFIYSSPYSVGNGEYSWTASYIHDGILRGSEQELSPCSGGPGDNQFATLT